MAYLSAWKSKWKSLLITLLFLTLALVAFSRFVVWVEARPGVELNDPLLNLLPVIDLTWPIFILIYVPLLVALWILSKRPERLIIALRSYAVLIVTRIVMMFLVPLAPPKNMIVLIDPVAGLGPGGALTKDLFFSGHTATIVLLLLCLEGKRIKVVYTLLAVSLGAMLLLQHVHYSVDVLVAPLFALFALSATRRMSKIREGMNHFQ